MKVHIYTFIYNRPEFIEMQARTLKKFVADDYEFIVFNDAKDNHHRQSIMDMCTKYNVKCINIPQEIHTQPYLPRFSHEYGWNHPSIRNSNVVTWAYRNYGQFHDGIAMLLDGDIIITKPINFNTLMMDVDIYGVGQSRVEGNKRVDYMWIGLIVLKIPTLPNKEMLSFNCGSVNNIKVDAGGASGMYLTSNPSVKVQKFNGISSFDKTHCGPCYDNYICHHNEKALTESGFDRPVDLKFIKSQPHKIEVFHNASFLHYRGGGCNLMGSPEVYHQTKIKKFQDYVHDLLLLEVLVI